MKQIFDTLSRIEGVLEFAMEELNIPMAIRDVSEATVSLHEVLTQLDRQWLVVSDFEAQREATEWGLHLWAEIPRILVPLSNVLNALPGVAGIRICKKLQMLEEKGALNDDAADDLLDLISLEGLDPRDEAFFEGVYLGYLQSL